LLIQRKSPRRNAQKGSMPEHDAVKLHLQIGIGCE
jgi:hypothetical protein